MKTKVAILLFGALFLYEQSIFCMMEKVKSRIELSKEMLQNPEKLGEAVLLWQEKYPNLFDPKEGERVLHYLCEGREIEVILTKKRLKELEKLSHEPLFQWFFSYWREMLVATGMAICAHPLACYFLGCDGGPDPFNIIGGKADDWFDLWCEPVIKRLMKNEPAGVIVQHKGVPELLKPLENKLKKEPKRCLTADIFGGRHFIFLSPQERHNETLLERFILSMILFFLFMVVFVSLLFHRRAVLKEKKKRRRIGDYFKETLPVDLPF